MVEGRAGRLTALAAAFLFVVVTALDSYGDVDLVAMAVSSLRVMLGGFQALGGMSGGPRLLCGA